MRTYVLVEGNGEAEAVLNLLSRLAGECSAELLPFAKPIRVPGIASEDSLLKYIELVRAKADARALLALRDDEDGCPKTHARPLAARLRELGLPFPSAVVLAYREYETLFLPCIERMAGRPLEGPGGARPGLRPDARYEGDFEANLESAIFGRYIDVVRRLHPGADLPGVFADEKLFADARRVMGELGEDKFFAPMNAGEKSDDAWGTIGQADVWTPARFESAVASTDPKVREELFNALVKTRYGAFAEESRQFVGLDEGLAILARHAKGLGYEGVVLLLDELILWLASRASHLSWFHNEVQKLVKLVEAQEAHRDVPLISFIARQRDLAEMVGRDHEGLQNALVRDSLQWSEGRFDTIRLDDRNLPAIAEKRILRAKGGDRKPLDDAFRAMRAKLGDAAWQLLLGELDEKEFRRLYPFSPVLMDALVALSNSLQRERTAIRLLTELLVEHVEDLQVGDVVGVGDLFDVIAGGDDSTDGIMRARFDSAKQLYAYQFLPVIQQANGTNTPDKCQRLRPSHPARLGCSNCPERACRAENRLVKTMLTQPRCMHPSSRRARPMLPFPSWIRLPRSASAPQTVRTSSWAQADASIRRHATIGTGTGCWAQSVLPPGPSAAASKPNSEQTNSCASETNSEPFTRS